MGVYLIATLSVLGILTTSWTVLKVLIGLGLVIFVHELGHFLVAKACGVKCEKFYLGFDVPIKLGPLRLPRTLARFQWGETEYGVGVIPLGGYVKMLGQDDNPANAQREAERIRIQKTGDEPAAEATLGEVATADSSETTAEPRATNEGGQADFELDPRSFPAKSVPQRMAIISAGVLMNLVFAVIFAAVAYHMGVLYEPCEVGSTSPGSPMWVDDVPAGTRIVQIGKQGRESDHLRFTWDLQQEVAHSGTGSGVQPLDLKLRYPDGQQQWREIVPSDRLKILGLSDFVMIGVRPLAATTLSRLNPVVPYMPAGQATPPLQGGDRIVGLVVDGQPLRFSTTDANEAGDLSATELETELGQHCDQPLRLLVERTEADAPATSGPVQLEVELPPNPLREIGLEMEIGPIEAVQRNSPASAAGIRPGDLIVSVAGKPIGDPLVLDQRFRQWVGQDVAVTVRRPDGESHQDITVQVQPQARSLYMVESNSGGLVSIEPIGVAFSIRNVVAAVAPDSPAEKAGFQAGDLLTRAQLVLDQPETAALVAKLWGRGYAEPVTLGPASPNWPQVFYQVQQVPSDTKLTLDYERGSEKFQATLQSVASQRWYFADRGLRLTLLQRVHTAGSWVESWRLGYRETKEQLMRVLVVLRKLVTLELSPRNLGGPLMIAAVASSEASQGIPRLLLFLTFLSANLVILNFLPIPALDGGHMVFLAAEGVTGKPVDERLQIALTLIGIALLLALMIFVTANDVGRFIDLFF